MNLEIRNKPFHADIHGYSGTAINNDYAGTAFRLMDKMWQTVKSNGLKNKGLNIWIYEQNERVFAGVELEDTPTNHTQLEQKTITLTKYAYYKHIGPYHLLKQIVHDMKTGLRARGLNPILPYIEIYGHWNKDETKLETELLMCLQ